MSQFKADKYTTRIDNILLEDFNEGGNGFTRDEIQGKVGKRFKDDQWQSVMKKVRNRVVDELGLMIPRATIEGGFAYKITDDPNELIPGALMNMRTIASNTAQAAREQRFIELREGKLDPAINGPVYEQMKILSEGQQLMERSMSLMNHNLRQEMDERRERLRDLRNDSEDATPKLKVV